MLTQQDEGWLPILGGLAAINQQGLYPPRGTLTADTTTQPQAMWRQRYLDMLRRLRGS